MSARTLVPCLMLLPLTAAAAGEPAKVPLWPKGAPGFESRKDEPEVLQGPALKNVNNPSLTVYLPPRDKATGTAIVVCPGGGHRQLMIQGEGTEPAEYLASIGVAAFVLKYRLPREPNSPYDLNKHPREDGQRAIRLVRSRAKEWGVDPNRVGIMGFSAGGEVVSWVTYAPGDGDPKAGDPIDRLSAKPSFQIVVYPGPLGVPDALPADVPPAFAIVANDDGAANVVTSILQKYRAVHRPIEVHVLSGGRHGFNMGKRSDLAAVKTWPQRLADWLGDNHLLGASPVR